MAKAGVKVKKKKWHEYREKVGNIFTRLGCDVTIDKSVKGARSEHDIDVYIKFNANGIKCLWIVDCKYWNRRVPKKEVFALQKIVEDVGADRGLLSSEVGFQSGAKISIQNSNITLTSLAELRQISKSELLK